MAAHTPIKVDPKTEDLDENDWNIALDPEDYMGFDNDLTLTKEELSDSDLDLVDTIQPLYAEDGDFEKDEPEISEGSEPFRSTPPSSDPSTPSATWNQAAKQAVAEYDLKNAGSLAATFHQPPAFARPVLAAPATTTITSKVSSSVWSAEADNQLLKSVLLSQICPEANGVTWDVVAERLNKQGLVDGGVTGMHAKSHLTSLLWKEAHASNIQFNPQRHTLPMSSTQTSDNTVAQPCPGGGERDSSMVQQRQTLPPQHQDQKQHQNSTIEPFNPPTLSTPRFRQPRPITTQGHSNSRNQQPANTDGSRSTTTRTTTTTAVTAGGRGGIGSGGGDGGKKNPTNRVQKTTTKKKTQRAASYTLTQHFRDQYD